MCDMLQQWQKEDDKCSESKGSDVTLYCKNHILVSDLKFVPHYSQRCPELPLSMSFPIHNKNNHVFVVVEITYLFSISWYFNEICLNQSTYQYIFSKYFFLSTLETIKHPSNVNLNLYVPSITRHAAFTLTPVLLITQESGGRMEGYWSQRVRERQLWWHHLSPCLFWAKMGHLLQTWTEWRSTWCWVSSTCCWNTVCQILGKLHIEGLLI